MPLTSQDVPLWFFGVVVIRDPAPETAALCSQSLLGHATLQ
jgi:hypothetical protein